MVKIMKNKECLTNYEMMQQLNNKIEENKMDVTDKITVMFFGILTILAVIITIAMFNRPVEKYKVYNDNKATIIEQVKE